MAEELSKKVLIGFILACLIAVIMFLFINKSRNEYWDIAEKEICKQSVELQAREKAFLRIQGDHLNDKFGNQAELKCSTDYITEKSKDDEVVKRRIADAMTICWDQFGRGKLEIFDTTDRNYCVICSRIEFTNKQQITDFTKFLIDEKPSYFSDQTYFKFLSSVTAKDNEILDVYDNSALKQDKINLEDPLAVIFVMGKNAFPDALWPGVEADKLTATTWGSSIGLVGGTAIGLLLLPTGVGTAAGAAILMASGVTGTLIGGNAGFMVGSRSAAEWDASVILWNYNKLSDLNNCNYLEGRSTPIKPIEMNKYK